MNEFGYGGVALMVFGWLATVGGTYMWQGMWPAVAALGIVAVLWGMTMLLEAALRETRR
jgi:hypothetical protein